MKEVCTKLKGLYDSSNIDWGVYFSSPFWMPVSGPFRWTLPMQAGYVSLFAVLAIGAGHGAQVDFLSHHYILLSVIVLLFIGINTIYFSLNYRRKVFEYIKDKKLSPSDERAEFEEVQRVEGKSSFFKEIAFKIFAYAVIVGIVASSDYLSLRIIAVMVVIDVVVFIAILVFARKMPLGRNAISLFDYNEGEGSA